MNKLNISLVKLTFTIIALICFGKTGFSQQIPNAGFENWAGGEPDSWNTTNMSVLFTQFITVTRETVAPQSGTSSAKLETVTHNIIFVGAVTLPGVLTLGILNIDPINQTASISGGTPFTGRPQSLRGYYKYLPSAGDYCLMGMGLTKWNNGVRDTIAYSYLAAGNTTNDWTAFSVPVVYRISETPDTMNIGIISSNIADGLAHTGSKLWVDSLSLVYGNVSIDGISYPVELKLFADPMRHHLIVKPDFDNRKNAELSVYTINGQLLIHQTATLSQEEVSIDINDLSPGTYVFRADIPGQKPFSRKFSIL